MRVSERVLVRIGPDAVDPAEALDFVADPGSGASCLFLGTVRDHSDAGDVTGLEYEAWEEIATSRLAEIAAEMLERWPASKVALVHRHGQLNVGEISVAVACSAPHREDAFAACRHGIERLKQDVPIWKKERLATGEAEWVMGS